MDDMPKRNGRGIELLADPTRRRIIAMLAIRPRPPSDLAGEPGLSRPATSRQPPQPEAAGLAGSFRIAADGRLVLYGTERRQQ
jgi:hypothetical protein